MRRRTVRRPRILLIGAACAWIPAAGPATAQETDLPRTAGAAEKSALPLPPGEYASRQIVSSRARLRPANRWVRVATTSIVLHRVRPAGDEATPAGPAGPLVVTSRYCAVEQDPLGRTRTTLGPGFVAAVPEWEAALVVRDGSVTVEDHVVVIGAELSDAAADDLPTDGEDPRVVDADGDGRPGFTVLVDGMVDGEVYMVQRLVRGLRGELEGGGRMSGTVTTGGGQEVIGASNQILKTFTPRFQPDPDASRSTFVWVPVPEGSTCEGVLADREALFGPPPGR